MFVWLRDAFRDPGPAMRRTPVACFATAATIAASAKPQDDFDRALHAARDGEGITFVLGPAGTGKSTLIRKLLEDDTGRTALVAPTGLAALNVGGMTLHRLMGWRGGPLPADALRPQGKLARMLQQLDRIVVDEIGMVRADVLDAMDAVLRHARGSDAPFGGLRLLGFGDFLQLAPVVTDTDARLLAGRGYRSPYAFSAQSLAAAPLRIVRLETVRRQNERALIEALGRLRRGDAMDAALGFLNERCHRPHRGRPGVVVTTTNRAAARYNQEGLAGLQGRERSYRGIASGDFAEPAAKLPAPMQLTLKVGTRVICTRNDDEAGIANGAVGTVRKLYDDAVRVRFDHDGQERIIHAVEWTSQRLVFDEANGGLRPTQAGSFRQLPLMVAFALTAHRAQGLSFDDLRVDTDKGAFAPGQTYVAVSRSRRLAGLSLAQPIRPCDVFVDPTLQRFDAWMRAGGSLPGRDWQVL